MLTVNAISLITAVESVLGATEPAFIQLPHSEMVRLNLISEEPGQTITSLSCSIVLAMC